MTKIIKNKTLTFISSISAITIIFIVFNCFIILEDYKKLEYEQNIKHIKSLISLIEENIRINNKNSTVFTASNELFSLIKEGKNSVKTKNILNSLNIDLLIFQNNSSSFYISSSQNSIKNMQTLKEEVIKIYKEFDNFNTIIEINKELFLITKTNHLNNTYYALKELSLKKLKGFSKNFSEINFIDEHIYSTNSDYKFNSLYFKKIELHTNIETTKIINKISFYGYKNKFLFSLELSNDSILIKEGKETITIFIIFVSIFLALLFYITYIYQKTVKKHNNELEEKVKERTHQIQSALNELEKVNLKLYDLAHTDFLTKTMNRRHFFMHAQNIFNEAKKNQKNLCVIMIDIDKFKQINDNYGHDMGDRVLISFSDCIKQHLNSEDIFGRLGGEEFAIVLNNYKLEDAIKKAEELRNEIEKIQIYIKDDIINITASFGITDIKNMRNIDEMLQKADTHLYSAKNSGRNRVRSRLNLI
ncbi:GGDEF domain-containing protein [Malaciobacter mytili]|uniref:GGDEF domain-containing protein n=1 Tax=Malaciobacter mytili TaxID=603050 RepID=UPI003BB0736F